MARHGRKREIVSLVSFIQTGELGSLKRGMSMRAVSELLGPPDWWMDGHDPDTSPVPLLWGYSRMLEIYFTYEAPHVVEVINVRQLPEPRQRHLRVRWGFWIRAGGISKETRISDLLRMPIWKDQQVTVGVLSDHGNIDILADKVEVLMHMWDDDEEALQNEFESGLSKPAYLARRNALSTGLHGICSMAEPRNNRYSTHRWEDFSLEEYLSLIDIGSKSTKSQG